MRVENNHMVQSLLKNSIKNGSSSGFDEILKTNLSYQKIDEEMDARLKNFKDGLSNMGAHGYLMSLNQQKIDEKVAQKKVELEKSFGLDDTNKSYNERAEIKALIEELVAEYKKLLEDGVKNNVLEQKQQSTQKQGSFVNLAQLISQIS